MVLPQQPCSSRIVELKSLLCLLCLIIIWKENKSLYNWLLFWPNSLVRRPPWLYASSVKNNCLLSEKSTKLFYCLFVSNRGDTIQYHGGLRSRELGQALMRQVFLFPSRRYHLTRINRWSDCIGYRIEIVCLIDTLSTPFENAKRWLGKIHSKFCF